MTFSPDMTKKPSNIEKEVSPAVKKELSQGEKAEQLQRKREIIQEEFESAQAQLDEVEAMLASPDLAPDRKAELEAEVKMIQSTMDSMEADLAELNNPEEVVVPIENTVVEKGDEDVKDFSSQESEEVKIEKELGEISEQLTQEKVALETLFQEELLRVNETVPKLGLNWQVAKELQQYIAEKKTLPEEGDVLFRVGLTDRENASLFDRATTVFGEGEEVLGDLELNPNGQDLYLFPELVGIFRSDLLKRRAEIIATGPDALKARDFLSGKIGFKDFDPELWKEYRMLVREKGGGSEELMVPFKERANQQAMATLKSFDKKLKFIRDEVENFGKTMKTEYLSVAELFDGVYKKISPGNEKISALEKRQQELQRELKS